MPSLLHRRDQTCPVNCVPRSDVMTAGTPNLETHPVMRASTHAAAVMDFKGSASTQRVDLSMMVRRCVCPSADEGSGPTRST